jgi:hypothetical protein
MNLRFVSASARMRWRVLMNSLERSGRRDRLERFSRAVEYLGPVFIGLMMLPTAAALGIAGLLAGAALGGTASPAPMLTVAVVRFSLVAVVAATLITPIAFPLGHQAGAIVRLLLIPVERAMLFLGQLAGAVADPWVAAIVPMIALVPIGLLWPGRIIAALVAAAAGALILGLLLATTTFVSSVVQLVLRDRRRAEVAMLIIVVVLPVLVMLPTMLRTNERRDRVSVERPAERVRMPAPLRTAIAVAPSELYIRAIQRAAGAQPGSTLGPLAGLAAWTLVVTGLAYAVYVRLLEVPAGTRRAAVQLGPREARSVPGLSPGASAVALAELRLVLRTPRGRSVLVAPLLVFLVFAIATWQRPGRLSLPFLEDGGGLALGAFGVAIMLMSIAPIVMNQFAIDRAGLTLTFLSPLSDRELLEGKAAAGALVLAAPMTVAIVLSYALLPGGPPGLWLALVLGGVAAYLTLSPVAAALSAIFPRAVDMNSIGSGSNPHQFANLLGLVALVLSVLPPVGLSLLAVHVLQDARLAAIFGALWCAAAAGLHLFLMRIVTPILTARRENLALVAGLR